MNATGLKSFTVNKHTYQLEALPPASGLAFGLKAATVLGPVLGDLISIADRRDGISNQEVIALLGNSLGNLNDAKVLELCNEALTHCYTPENESLKDGGVYDKWFSEHPDELLIAAGKAVFLLAKDFFPQGLTI